MQVKGGRPRFQRGCLVKGSGSWIGRYRVRDANDVAQRRNVTIGRIDQMTEKEAREKLMRLIYHDNAQTTAVRVMGSSGTILPKSDLASTAGCRRHERGCISELLVCCDLAQKGYQVFRPISPSAPCDLLAMDRAWKILRVEVKTATPTRSGKVAVDLRTKMGKFDMVAFVFADGRIEYRSPGSLTNLRYPLTEAPKPATEEAKNA